MKWRPIFLIRIFIWISNNETQSIPVLDTFGMLLVVDHLYQVDKIQPTKTWNADKIQGNHIFR